MVQTLVKKILSIMLVLLVLVGSFPLPPDVAKAISPTTVITPTTVVTPTTPPDGGGGVYTTLEGRVTQKVTGLSLSGVKLVLKKYTDNSFVGQATSSSNGYYRIEFAWKGTGYAWLIATLGQEQLKNLVYIREGINHKDVQMEGKIPNTLKGEIYKKTPVVISGVVTYKKEPVANAQIRIYKSEDPNTVLLTTVSKLSVNLNNEKTAVYSISDFRLKAGEYIVVPYAGDSANAQPIKYNGAAVKKYVGFMNDTAETKIVNLEANGTVPTVLTGKVVVNGSPDIPVSGAQVQLYYGSTKVDEFTASYDGSYTVTANQAGWHTVKVYQYGMYTSATVALSSGINRKDIYLQGGKNNVLKGSVYHMDGTTKVPAIGVRIKAVLNSNQNVVYTTTTDARSGSYSISPILPGTFTLYVTNYGDSAQQIASPKTTTFNERANEVHTVDFALSSPGNTTGKMIVHVLDPYEGAIQGAFVEIWRIDHLGNTILPKTVMTGTTDATGKVAFPNLVPGIYNARVTKSGYDTNNNWVSVFENETYYSEVNVYLYSPASYGCDKHPQAHVENFFFCGNEAKQLYLTQPARWSEIDGIIANLRTRYPNLSTLPHQVIISSSKANNASYLGAEKCSIPAPSLTVPDHSYDYIDISTTHILGHPNTLEHSITHEFGHGKDWRLGSCTGLWSSRTVFSSIYSYGALFGDAYFTVLKDGTYDNNLMGHPADNTREGFASAFHDANLHNSEFAARADATYSPLKETLHRTVNLAY